MLLPPGIPADAGRGIGPIHFVVPAAPRFLDFFAQNSAVEASGWRSAETLWLSEPRYHGPVLVRGRDVEGEARIGFGTAEQPKFEFRLPAGPWEQRDKFEAWGRTAHLQEGWRASVVVLRVRKGGCYFLQIDGKRFTERSLVGAIWQDE